MPSFGPLEARLLIVGLAPGLKGANQTGRPFTGDYAGELLYPTLLRYGFAHGPYGARADDGLTLDDCRITNAVRCVPPANKPVGAEIGTCRPFLAAEIAAMGRLEAVVALGVVAHNAVLAALGLRQSHVKFTHGARHAPPQRAEPDRQLSLLALQYEHRPAHGGDVSRRLRGRAVAPGRLGFARPGEAASPRGR